MGFKFIIVAVDGPLRASLQKVDKKVFYSLKNDSKVLKFLWKLLSYYRHFML